MTNYPNTKSKSNHHGISHPPPPSEIPMFDIPDQSFMKQSAGNFSIFANQQAMSSNLSINQQDPLFMHHPFSSNNNYHQNNSEPNTNVDFLPNMYGLNEFEFNNVSFESLPATGSHHDSQFDLVDNSDWYPCPYTPTLNDNHSANFSEASFTSQNDYANSDFSQPNSILQQQSQNTPINPNSITKRNLTMQLQAQSNSHSQLLAQTHSHSPLSQHMSSSNANLNYNERTTPIAISSSNIHESPTPSNLQQTYNTVSGSFLGSANSSQTTSTTHQPPSMIFHSPSTANSSTSPIVNQYKALDINSPILPPQNSFRHNSDSSFNSTNSSIETPRRYPSQGSASAFPHKISLHHNNSNLDLTPPVFTPVKTITKKSSMSSLNSSSDPTKPKKYTRKRILPRSKNGCWICRIKHLKCDEFKPVCKSCQRFGIECDYSPDKPLYVTDKNLRKEKLASIVQVRKSSTSLSNNSSLTSTPTNPMKRKKSKAKLLG